MRWVLSIVLIVSACNNRLGLDPVGSEPDDLDNDGIAYDNCREVANTSQDDGDGDGLGDACDPCPLADTQAFIDADHDKVDDGCDPCPLGRQHDEDGDGLFDACDNCPIVANLDQANVDADGVGDACEVTDSSENQRVYFDAFAPADPRWMPSTSPWEQQADWALTPLLAPSTTAKANLFRSPDFSATGDAWSIDIGVEIVNPIAALYVVLDNSGSGETYTCTLQCSAGTCTVKMNEGAAGASFALSGPLRIQISNVLGKFNGAIVCTVAGTPLDTESSIGVTDEEFGLSVGATTNARIHHLYVQR